MFTVPLADSHSPVGCWWVPPFILVCFPVVLPLLVLAASNPGISLPWCFPLSPEALSAAALPGSCLTEALPARC